MRTQLGAAAFSAVLAGSCTSSSAFSCTDDAQCVDGDVQGFCEANGFCSFPDETCSSGRRFGDLAGGLSSMCVPPGDTGTSTDPSTSSTSASASSGEQTTTTATTLPLTTDPSTSTTSLESSGTDTESACEEQCLDYEPQWQVPIASAFAGVYDHPSGEPVLVGSYGIDTDIGGFPVTNAGDADLFFAWVENGAIADVATVSGVGDTWVLGADVDPAGRLYVAGAYAGTPSVGGTALPSAAVGGFVSSYEDTGTYRWALAMEAPSLARAWSVAHVGNSVYVVGDFQDDLVFATENATSAGFSDGMVARIHQDSANVLAFHHITGPLEDLGSGVVATGGGFVATGIFSGTLAGGGDSVDAQGGSDVWIQRYDNAGAPQWTRSFGGGLDEAWSFIDADAAGNLYLIAGFQGDISFDDGATHSAGVAHDIVLAKFAANGDRQWSTAIASTGDSRAWDVSANADGRVAISLTFASAVAIGGRDVNAQGEEDGLLAIYDADGTLQWFTTYGGELQEGGNDVLLYDEGQLYVSLGFLSSSIDVGLGAAAGVGDGVTSTALVVYYPAPS